MRPEWWYGPADQYASRGDQLLAHVMTGAIACGIIMLLLMTYAIIATLANASGLAG